MNSTIRDRNPDIILFWDSYSGQTQGDGVVVTQFYNPGQSSIFFKENFLLEVFQSKSDMTAFSSSSVLSAFHPKLLNLDTILRDLRWCPFYRKPKDMARMQGIQAILICRHCQHGFSGRKGLYTSHTYSIT